MGDTLTHLNTHQDIRQLLRRVYSALEIDGQVILTFRDLTSGLKGLDRIIPVRNDANTIFTCFLEYEKEISEFKLKTINRLQKGLKPKPRKRTSKAAIVEHVLQIAGRPLHISEIIQIANRDFNVQLERDSIVSILIKKIKAGQTFIRTAPNTFALKE